jgi:hypothetical protein
LSLAGKHPVAALEGAGKEDKDKETKSKPNEPLVRRTGELNGSFSGSACFTLLLTGYEKRTISMSVGG